MSSSEASSGEFALISDEIPLESPASQSVSDADLSHQFSPPTSPLRSPKRRRLTKKRNRTEGGNDSSEAESETGSGGPIESAPGGVATDGGSLHNEDVAVLNAAESDINVPQQLVDDNSSSFGSSLPEHSCSGSDNSENEKDNSGGSESESSRNLLCSSVPTDTEDEDAIVSVSVDNDLGEGSEPLYGGSKKTKDEAVLEVLDLYLTNKWTKKSLEGVLKCMASTLPEDNQLPPTLHRLFQYLKAHSLVIEEIPHFYCSLCLSAKECMSDICLKCQTSEGGVFFELPIKAQIKFFLESYGLAEAIDNFPLIHEDSVLKDIHDGEEFIRVKSKCTGKYDITLLWNTDGVDLSESSRVKLWPVQAVICEVPYYLRPKFTFVCLVWIANCKPKMNMYLKPFVKSLIDLWANGVEWTHPITKEKIVSKVVAPALSADAPATADVLSIQDVTAIYGCNLCEQEAAPVPALIKRQYRTVRRFTYQKEPAQIRTSEMMKNQALNAKRIQKPYLGVKGRSVVRKLPLFDIALSVPIDYMHCVLLGVVKRFTNLWFFVKSVAYERDWYIGDRLEEGNKFISDSVKVPAFVTREPRGLDMLDDWKASELLTWLLYHSLPVLISLEMPTHYVKHHMLLVRAIFLLLKDRISESDLDQAQRLVSKYVEQVAALYRKQDLVYNVHSLLHLPLCVRRWGPLFATSAFRFEDFNGTLASMVHGTKHQAKELVKNLSLARGICTLKWKAEQSKCKAARDTVVLERKRAASQDEMIPLQEKNITSSVTEVYDKCDYYGQNFTSKTYDEKVNRANSFVLVRKSPESPESLDPGQVINFFRCEGGVFCTIEMFRLSNLEVLVNFTPPHICKIEHLIPVHFNGEREKLVCNVSCIAEKLVRAGNYLCRRPNKYEKKL